MFCKFRKLFVVVMACVVTLAFVACDYEGGEIIRELPGPPGTIEENRNLDYAVEGFLLTIAVEENVLPYGQRFQVQAELENLREEDVEISFIFFFDYSVPNWNGRCCGYGCLRNECERWLSRPMAYDLPTPQFMYFPSNGIIRNRFRESPLESSAIPVGRTIGGNHLPPGKHELRMSARFNVSDEKISPNHNAVVVWSNTITIVVQ